MMTSELITGAVDFHDLLLHLGDLSYANGYESEVSRCAMRVGIVLTCQTMNRIPMLLTMMQFIKLFDGEVFQFRGTVSTS